MDFPIDFSQHPCFNPEVRHRAMRIHLPVAPRCNIQCNFCSRRFDCVNESRPGVTQALLNPVQALHYLEQMVEKHPQIKVVGIAGPGDPFANPEETMGTLRLVRQRFPEMILCLATNGLQLLPYVPELGELKVSHVSITVNAIQPEIGAKIYSWIRVGKQVIVGPAAAEQLLQNQLAAIPALKAANILVKINTVVMAGINDEHVLEIAAKVKTLGADLLNPMAMYPNRDTVLGMQHVPSLEKMRELKKAVGEILPVMHHCTRCRADAIGLLGASESEDDQQALQAAAAWKPTPTPQIEITTSTAQRPNIAVASREGLLVDQHLGEANLIWIYRAEPSGMHLLEKRPAPISGSGDQRWQALGELLQDCSAILVSGIGARPRQVLAATGLTIHQMEGLIQEIVPKLVRQENVAAYQVASRKCGEACQGNGNGCG